MAQSLAISNAMMDYSAGVIKLTLANPVSGAAIGDRIQVSGIVSKRYEYDYKDAQSMLSTDPFFNSMKSGLFNHDAMQIE